MVFVRSVVCWVLCASMLSMHVTDISTMLKTNSFNGQYTYIYYLVGYSYLIFCKNAFIFDPLFCVLLIELQVTMEG